MVYALKELFRIGALGHHADGRVHPEQTGLIERRFKLGADI
jgi:hypothetical protein